MAIYRIKVYENKKKIFETAFDRLQPGDVRHGHFVYDISKSTIKGGVSYVYVLCRKEGNSYSGIKTLRDGYTNFSNNENQKNISISVSDFAGNEETLNFKIRQKLSGSNQGIGYVSVDQKKNTTTQNSDNTIQINIPDNALHADTLMKIEEPVNPEIIAELCKSYSVSGSDLLKTFSVLPHDTIYKKPIKISIKKPSGISDDEIKHIQIFQFFEGRKPGALKTSYSLYQSQFTAESYTNGFFALIIDKTPPEIFLPPTFELCEDREIYRNIRLYTSDNLSRINKNSIICIIDGETYPYTFDEDRKWIEVKLPRKVISNGIHHIFAKAFDEAENEAVFRGLLTFE